MQGEDKRESSGLKGVEDKGGERDDREDDHNVESQDEVRKQACISYSQGVWAPFSCLVDSVAATAVFLWICLARWMEEKLEMGSHTPIEF